MKTEITGGKIFREGSFVENVRLVVEGNNEEERVIVPDSSFILPSFCDVHVHFREPGQDYKETIKTGSLAAARGGYTSVCAMPNLDPPPTDLESLGREREIIKRDAIIGVHPYGTITAKRDGKGTLSEMEALAPFVCGFSDDGTGVSDGGLMHEAMERACNLGKVIAAHCEDMDLLRDGKVRESEWRQIERDLKLADDTGVKYHVCHISCAESVEIIRDAKKSGVDVSCETAPHYLLLDLDDVNKGIGSDPKNGGRFKMNPPIKDRADRFALIEGLSDGTVDMIATDHAPHSEEEKSIGFERSLNGITGLECAFPVLYSGLVRNKLITLAHLIEAMSYAPRKRFGLADEGFTIIDLTNDYLIDSNSFMSKGKCTPFDGMRVYGKTLLTVFGDRIVYRNI